MNNGQITILSGWAIPLRGDDIDTDRIIPARYLRCVTFDGLGSHAFEDDREQASDHPFNQQIYQRASIMIVGKNFGCGSSREHAPQSLQRWGIKAIIGKSFAEIFFGNCQSMGIPCLKVSDEDGDALFQRAETSPSLMFSIDIKSAMIDIDDCKFQAAIPQGVQTSFLEGTWNQLNILRKSNDAVDSLAAKLPYLNNFGS